MSTFCGLFAAMGKEEREEEKGNKRGDLKGEEEASV